ncbi:hypothetical protein [Thalassotalea sp. ND16A]|uniref:hypothetical protein n=1 Tax=Thalassotalea sp. ND16A TaxID=1535422 RepID=UPI00051D940C|nr:hypothetical protein [Thalassotalea sp. ND16A]KGK01091.1 hypothetical protein ND16A_3098 [Thalassotalea sp. ND16A]
MSDSKLTQTSVPIVITEQAQCMPKTPASNEQAAREFSLSLDFQDADQQCFVLGYN